MMVLKKLSFAYKAKKKNRYLLFRCLSGLFALLLVACSSAVPQTVAPQATLNVADQRPLVLGDISDDPSEVINGTQPLADYLASQLAEQGITEGRVRIAASTDEMIDLLKSGAVDLYFDSVYPAALIQDATGAQIILRRWRFGVEQYHTVIYASKASGITRLEQLKGQMVAMDAPYSTSGFFMPAVYLTQSGLNLVGKPNYDSPVEAAETGFVFSYDDENTLQWVLRGEVTAGVMDNYLYDVLFPREAIDQMVVLARTESVPRQVVVVRPGLETGLMEAVKQALISADESPEGQAALEKFQTTQFDEFPEGIQSAIERMRVMMQVVQGIPLP